MILVNGQPAENVGVLDRGLAYGDGVFRTLCMHAGGPLWWHDHYVKLAADCAALMIVCPEEAGLHAEVCRAAEAGERVVKILITRGVGARGYALPPKQQMTTRIVLSTSLPAYAQAATPGDINARWCALRLARQPRLAGCKHLNRLEYVLARAEWKEPDIF